MHPWNRDEIGYSHYSATHFSERRRLGGSERLQSSFNRFILKANGLLQSDHIYLKIDAIQLKTTKYDANGYSWSQINFSLLEKFKIPPNSVYFLS